jgi:cell division protein FtsW
MKTTVDKPLVICTLALCLCGLVAVYTASAHQSVHEAGHSWAYVLKQLLAFGLGLTGMGLFSRIPYTRWQVLSRPLALVSIVLLVLTMFIGTTANGSERWIPLPFGLQFQPSDVAKIAGVLLIASAAAQRGLFSAGALLNYALVLVMVGLIYLQPNLSVSMLLTMVGAALLYMAGLNGWLYVVLAPPTLYGLFLKIKDTEYQWRRITGWLNPWKDMQDTGYNLVQSYFAIGSGGFLGVGLGHSIQKQYYLPFQHTDFIFSVWCEELGLLGGLILMILYGVLAFRGFNIAFQVPSLFGQLLAAGLTLMITLQATINMCVTMGLMPVTGVTLPLISYGGTSVIITLCMIGILLNISRHRQNVQPMGPA